MASNDVAVGKIVSAITRSKVWGKFAIFIIEDDAQNGPDHVDSHRTTGLVISPYVKRKHVDSTMYSTVSRFTEILHRLGISSEIEVKIAGRGTESAAMVARGKTRVSIQPVSEILHMPGVELAGTLPTELRYKAVFAAALIAGSKQAEASRRLIAFLSSERAMAAIKRSGMEPSRRRLTGLQRKTDGESC